jgi:UDP-glucose 4-epimerase
MAVVGAACPLGRHLVPALLAAGHHVRCVVREPSRIPAPWLSDPRCEVTTALEDSNQVVWLTHVRHPDPHEEVTRNVKMMEAACQGERRLVFISSGGSVYGEPQQQMPVREDHPRRPVSAYGMAKCAMEDIVAAAADRAGAGVILRPGNIYGREYLETDGRGAVAVFTRTLLADDPVTLRDGGRGARDFIHVDDVVRAIVAAVTWQRGLAVWNVGTGVATATRDVLHQISDIIDCQPVEILHQPRNATDVSAIALASTLIESECGWSPTYTLTAGLRSVLEDVSACRPPSDRPAEDMSQH